MILVMKMTFKLINKHKADSVLFSIANLFNVLTGIILFERPFSLTFANDVFVWSCFATIEAVVYNLINRREWWATILPAVFLVFLLVELVFDYILKLDFRQTNLFIVYLVIFYLGQLAMIGFSFAALRKLGYLTLATYFVTLVAAIFEAVAVW